MGKKKLVRSVPTELNKDHNEILELAQVTSILGFLLFNFCSLTLPFNGDFVSALILLKVSKYSCLM